eukprot:TRINITY_DN95154_c0_g1_i1.p1 TRINITY_DN95154_c0_g1~~TRINITY_DN95154_c0_g1_i1.p1  ORF type:complete len:601 (+),score=82.64 TRINITY_DN95154_c0_g1_i1:46-1848(+)
MSSGYIGHWRDQPAAHESSLAPAPLAHAPESAIIAPQPALVSTPSSHTAAPITRIGEDGAGKYMIQVIGLLCGDPIAEMSLGSLVDDPSHPGFGAALKGYLRKHCDVAGGFFSLLHENEEILDEDSWKDNGEPTVVQLLKQEHFGDFSEPLLEGASNGHCHMVKGALERRQDPSCRDSNGRTALWRASCGGHLDIIQLLVAAHGSPKRKQRDASDALLIAVQQNLAELVRVLIKAGADVNYWTRELGTTSLNMAAELGHFEVLRILIDAGANPDLRTDSGESALCLAAQKGFTSVVRFLIDVGASVRAGTDNVEDVENPLFPAAQQNQVEIARLLINARADLNAGNPTPLFVAAYHGHLEVVRLLIDCGADKDAANSDGKTPLWVAALQGHAGVARFLLEAGSDKDKAPSEEDALQCGATPLFKAAQNDCLDVVRILIAAGADMNQPYADGATPMFIAAMNGSVEVVRCLLNALADMNKANLHGATPFHTAAGNGHLEVVRLLHSYGAKQQAMLNGATPLSIAKGQGNDAVAQFLAVGESGRAVPAKVPARVPAKLDDEEIPFECSCGFTAGTRAALDRHLARANSSNQQSHRVLRGIEP